MTLISLPDCKALHQFLTIGKEYAVELWGNNGYRITMDNNEDVIILRGRMK